jgi:hypothetical protein
MRAHTITTINRRRPNARRRRVLALAIGICALAIPATASADPSASGYATPNAITGGSSGTHVPQFPSARQIAMHRGTLPPAGSPKIDPGDTSPNAIVGGVTLRRDGSEAEPFAVEPSGSTGDGFDWASAAVGAGAAMALVALGGAALLTVRRRSTVSPSPSKS